MVDVNHYSLKSGGAELTRPIDEMFNYSKGNYLHSWLKLSKTQTDNCGITPWSCTFLGYFKFLKMMIYATCRLTERYGKLTSCHFN